MRRTPHAQGATPQPDDGRTLRALVDLTDLLARLNQEAELLRAGLQLVADALDPGGATLWLAAAGGELEPSLQGGGECPEPEQAAALVAEVLDDGEARVRGLSRGGWVAAASLGPREKRLGVLSAHDGR